METGFVTDRLRPTRPIEDREWNPMGVAFFNLISDQLPCTPASILAVGGDTEKADLDGLRKKGYRVHFLPHPMRSASPISLHSNGGVSRNKGQGPDVDGEHDYARGRYDALLILGFPKDPKQIKDTLNKGSAFLKQKGLVLICHARNDEPTTWGVSAHLNPNDVIAALYEAGFSIQLCEEIDKNVNGHHSEKTAAAVYDALFVGRKDGIFVRGYEEGDETEILNLFNRAFATPRTVEHWYWKFRDNPFGSHKIAQAFTADGSLMGHYSGYPVPFYASCGLEQAFVSYQIGDIMTRPSARQVGLANTSVLGRITDYFHRTFCFGKVPFIYGFVAGNHKRFGERFLRYRYLSKIPYHVLDPAVCTLNLKRRFQALISGLSVREVTQVTTEFDTFFDEVSEDYGLLVKRTGSYLKWRYLDCPDGRHTLMAVKRFGRLVGWSVFSRRDDVLIWGDALFKRTLASPTIRFMLDQVLTHHFPDVARIEGWFSPAPHWWGEVLKDMGFSMRDEPNGLVSGVTLFDESFSLKWINNNFYCTMGDSDLF